jgi:hypothetical protein
MFRCELEELWYKQSRADGRQFDIFDKEFIIDIVCLRL